jgi:hypothetical protein
MSNFFSYMRMGQALMINPVGLFGVSCLLSTVVIHLILESGLFSGMESVGFFILAGVSWLILVVIITQFVSAPLWGGFYSYRIKQDYGPKTQLRVKNYFQDPSSTQIDIDLVAKEEGELR